MDYCLNMMMRKVNEKQGLFQDKSAPGSNNSLSIGLCCFFPNKFYTRIKLHKQF